MKQGTQVCKGSDNKLNIAHMFVLVASDYNLMPRESRTNRSKFCSSTYHSSVTNKQSDIHNNMFISTGLEHILVPSYMFFRYKIHPRHSTREEQHYIKSEESVGK